MLEQVDECQSPLFLAVELERPVADGDAVVHLFFSAPAEAPTTRGFAGILHEGLDGLTAGRGARACRTTRRTASACPRPCRPLRLRGMVAMLSRIKRQVRLKSAA